MIDSNLAYCSDPGHKAIVYADGKRYVNGEFDGEVKKNKKNLSKKYHHVSREYFTDTVVNPVVHGKAVMSKDWAIFYEDFYLNEQNKKDINKANSTTKKIVDAYGLLSGERRFIFRDVQGEYALPVEKLLGKTIPPTEKIITRMKDAIKLSRQSFAQGRASWKKINIIAFYYLPLNAQLEFTLDEGSLKYCVKASKTPLIFVYSILPNVDRTKFNSIVKIFTEKFNPNIGIVSSYAHPAEIKEPPTIRSYP